MTLLCVAITVHDLPQAHRDAALASERGADIVEYRVDSFTDLEAVRSLVQTSPAPCIVTCRPTWEGGACDLPDQERIPVLETASLAGAAYIDVELVAYSRSANLRQKVHFNAGSPIDQTAPRENRKGLIVSSHDFEGRPPKLSNLVSYLNDSGGNVAKVVWTARSLRDNLEAFEILRARAKPTIALCMGEAGILSRLLAPKFGGFLTFASLRSESVTAPGQPTLDDMLELYRFRSINPATQVFGVVGHPVAHSISPHVHNPALASAGLNAVYVPLLVAPGYESFKAFMETLGRDEHLDLTGLSVTLPHKENAYRYVREHAGQLSDIASQARAVNTLHLSRTGTQLHLRATSTDHAAILRCIEKGLSDAGVKPADASRPLKGLSIAILGAGGTARTAVHALVTAGATVTIYNRTPEKAQSLASEFAVASAPLEALSAAPHDVYVNTTSLGMSPDVESTPWPEVLPQLTPRTVVFDTVYTPIETTFLRQAKDAGATTVPGVEMFAHQAAAQFHFWTGLTRDTSSFRADAERALLRRG
jgi:3-dehydroquinate dehydratase/shikimate dehydrogenase